MVEIGSTRDSFFGRGKAVKIALGTFARSGIEAKLGTDLAVGVRAALLHYTRRLKSEWAPVGPPQFRWGQTPLDAGTAFELAIGPEMEAALEREAHRYQVPVDQILLHAIFVYLADLDSSSPTKPFPDAPVL